MSKLMSGKMKEPVQQILEYLKDNDTITTTIGKKITGKSEVQVRRYLKVLTDCGVIKSKKQQKEICIQGFKDLIAGQITRQYLKIFYLCCWKITCVRLVVNLQSK